MSNARSSRKSSKRITKRVKDISLHMSNIVTDRKVIMKPQFILYRRNGTYYCEDTKTGKQQALRTKDES